MSSNRRTWRPRRKAGTVPYRSPEEDDPLALILARLRPYPQAQLETYANGVEVVPPGPMGFPVTFAEVDGRFRVTCDGWYAYFRSPEEALTCFFKALSPAARLRLTLRGTTRCRWRLELQSVGGWAPLVERVRIAIPFWRRAEVRYLQNHLLDAA
jgi:hypothetical protein